jgi:hypothetical protein
MSELKLRRLTEHNQRLREDLARPRVRMSEASQRCVSDPSIYITEGADLSLSLIRFCKTTKDHLVRLAPVFDALVSYEFVKALSLIPGTVLISSMFASGAVSLGTREQK